MQDLFQISGEIRVQQILLLEMKPCVDQGKTAILQTCWELPCFTLRM